MAHLKQEKFQMKNMNHKEIVKILLIILQMIMLAKKREKIAQATESVSQLG